MRRSNQQTDNDTITQLVSSRSGFRGMFGLAAFAPLHPLPSCLRDKTLWLIHQLLQLDKMACKPAAILISRAPTTTYRAPSCGCCCWEGAGLTRRGSPSAERALGALRTGHRWATAVSVTGNTSIAGCAPGSGGCISRGTHYVEADLAGCRRAGCWVDGARGAQDARVTNLAAACHTGC